MSDFRRYITSEKRQLISYPRFLSLTGNKVFICLDKGVLEIAKYLLNSRGSWRTTYVKENRDYGYFMPTEEEFQLITEAIAEANIDMASCDEIVTALEGIKSAIQVTGSANGNSGCGGCGSTGGNPGIVPITATVFDVTEGTEGLGPGGLGVPTTFDGTVEEYEEYKCKAANFVYASIIGAMRFIGALSSASAAIGTGEGFGTWLLSTLFAYQAETIATTVFFITGWEIAALVAVIALATALVAIPILFFFDAWADGVETVKEDFICDLYTSSDPDNAHARIISRLSDAIATIGFGPPYDAFSDTISGMLYDVLEYFAPYALNNVLFENNAQVEAWEGEDLIDCSSCEEATGDYEFDHGTETSEHPANPIVGLAEDNSSECANGEFFAIIFHSPVTVTEITVNGAPSSLGGCGECSGQNVFWYFSNEAATTLIQSGSARPQDDVPVSGVRYLLVELDCDGTTPTVSVTYTVD
jgi:hypothetical protein